MFGVILALPKKMYFIKKCLWSIYELNERFV